MIFATATNQYGLVIGRGKATTKEAAEALARKNALDAIIEHGRFSRSRWHIGNVQSQVEKPIDTKTP